MKNSTIEEEESRTFNVTIEILDSETALVSWEMAETPRHLLSSLEIIFSPVDAR